MRPAHIVAYGRPHLFWRNASLVLACSRPAGNFSVQGEFQCRTFHHWRCRVDPCRIRRSSLCAAWSHTNPTCASPCQPGHAVLNIFWQIWSCFALVYLTAGGAFLAGGLVAYSWYLFVHHCAHHGHDRSPLPLLEHHRSHHKFATRNYGVSTTLWDRVFKTMLH